MAHTNVAHKSGTNTVEITCPPDRHIPVAFNELYTIVKGSMSISTKMRYEEVCQLLESLYAQEYMSLRRNIKSNFLPFSAGARGHQLPCRIGKPLPPKADLDLKEEKLVADLLLLMAQARYSLITQEEWAGAMSEKFLFHLPVSVNWGFFDSKLLTGFWSSNSERRALRAKLPELADRVLIFHRGVSTAHDSGRYINQKIDLLVDYLVVWPAMWLWAWLVAHCPWGRKPALLASMASAKASLATAAATAATYSSSRTTSGITGVAEVPDLDTEDLHVGAAPILHRAAKVVERRTLSRLMPNAWSVVQSFPGVLHIQEPCFDEMVIVFRTSGAGRKSSSKVPVRSQTSEDRLKHILGNRNIHIKAFSSIPFADCVAVLPDKKVYLKTLTIINMIVQGIMAFFGAMAVLRKAGSVDLSAMWSALSLVGARCGHLYSSAQAERSQMVQDMTHVLYDKTNDSQEGVISMLLEDMAEQQLKETVLAYTLLHQDLGESEEGLTETALDDKCEDFLELNFNLRLDFAVEDALPRLVQWGLVKYHPYSQKYQAVPIEEAYTILSGEWVRSVKALSQPPKIKRLPLATLVSSDRQGHAPISGELSSSLAGASGTSSQGSPSPSTGTDHEMEKDSKSTKFLNLFKRKKSRKEKHTTGDHCHTDT